MEEIWKDIPGYIGYYKISKTGKIKSATRTVVCRDGNKKPCKGKILKNRLQRIGYYQTLLCKDGIKKYCYIHRLLADAFIPNPNNLPVINHKNGLKSDNRLENLEWCTRKHNIQHAVITGLMGGDKSSSKLTVNQVREIRSLLTGEFAMESKDVAAKFNISYRYVRNIAKKERWKYA